MGSSFALDKLGPGYVSPLLRAGLRFTVAGALLAPVAADRDRRRHGRDAKPAAGGGRQGRVDRGTAEVKTGAVMRSGASGF